MREIWENRHSGEMKEEIKIEVIVDVSAPGLKQQDGIMVLLYNILYLGHLTIE